MEILAQTTAPAGPATQTGKPPPGWFQFLASYGPIILIILVFYFLVFGSKKKQERQRQDMLNQLKKGDRIQTIGGILGTVIEVRDSDVLVKVDESSNTKIRFSRSAVHRVVEEDKSESK
jgi:preprotein translocase subunit YajC